MFDFNRIRLIATREVRTRVAMRSYRISLLVQVLIVAAIALSPVIIAKYTDSDSGPQTEIVGVVDQAEANAVVSLQQMLTLVSQGSNVLWDIQAFATVDDARDALESGEIDELFVVTRAGEELEFTLISESGDAQSAEMQLLAASAQSIAINDTITTSDLTAGQITQIFALPEIKVSSAAADSEVSAEEETSIEQIVHYVLAYALTIIIFIFVVMYGQWIAQGVVEEKSNRIMEIMVNAATPRDLLAGKVIGIMMTALMQFIPIALVAGIIASFQKQIGSLFGVSEDRLFDLNLGAVTWQSMGWFLVYFILGFLLYGALYAGVGSLVSRQEEVSTALMPMTMVMMLGYFAALGSMGSPDGLIARIAYLFPGTTVFVAMLRLINGDPQTWEIVASIGGLVVAILLALLLAGRLYRVGVLMYGQAPKFSQIFRLGDMQKMAR